MRVTVVTINESNLFLVTKNVLLDLRSHGFLFRPVTNVQQAVAEYRSDGALFIYKRE